MLLSGGGAYLFDDLSQAELKADGNVAALSSEKVQAKQIELTVVGKPINANGTEARVTYRLSDGQRFLQYSIEITNKSDAAQKVTTKDSLRCDGPVFRFGSDEATRLFFAADAYFQQCYGFVLDEGVYEQAADKRTLNVKADSLGTQELAVGGRLAWSGKLYCSQGLPGVRSWAASVMEGGKLLTLQLRLQSPTGPIETCTS